MSSRGNYHNAKFGYEKETSSSVIIPITVPK
ncbi:MAG TPA: hypothetical protein DHV15_06320 [Treponema sp.]|uniref:Uncharacterized protein n=1 Tax=Treponema denticola (strain ATCC 35405 / DSM 14222 / CIP 103919 / JCM 8153 / KCTC 15104) TaxID=243275 RepID=Q73PH8_TREDE|nr:hypothetical protein TDE_0821 [Treponema denticola ATCC 35405]HCY95116.1 hypothetical protein [Treponema sp.]